MATRVNSSKMRGNQPDVLMIPNGIDSSTFFTPTIPDDLKTAFELIHQQPIEILSALIGVIFQYIVKGERMSMPSKLYTLELSHDEINSLLTAIHIIVQTAIRTKSKVSTIKNDLLAMNMPAAFVEEICKEVVASRSQLETRIISNRIQFAKLERLRWRIDVTISSGSLSRIMRPNILAQFILKDGRVKTFEIPIEQFNQLRYSVAKVLHGMQTLERHPIIKIVNEFRRREEEEYNN